MKNFIYTSILCLLCSPVFAQGIVSGNIYNDPNAGTVQNSASPFSLPDDRLVVYLINNATNTVVHVIYPGTTNVFAFPSVPNGSYTVMLNTGNYSILPGATPPPSLLESSWTYTGESMDAAGTPDALADGKINITIAGSAIPTVKFGIQERPFADDKRNTLVSKTAASQVPLSINATSSFTKGSPTIFSGTDSAGGSIVSYSISTLPLHGTLYLGSTPVTTLAAVTGLSMSQVNTLGYLPNATALLHEQDMFSYYVTDNANSKSNNASYVIPFALLDADGDGVPDRVDVDDDNDGITDVAECGLNDLMTQYGQLLAGAYKFISPKHFGYTTVAHRTGLNLEADLSSAFGKAPGAIIVRATNANTHPTDTVFYMNDATGPTKWEISGALGSYAVIEQGQQYFSFDKRTITLLDSTMSHYVLAQGQNNASQGKWSMGNDNYNWWVRADTQLGNPTRLAQLMIALFDPGPKYFSVASTCNNLNEFATYFIRLLPECDHDNDGLGNRVDLDSDNDGCLDALEGSATFPTSSLVNAGGTVTVGFGSTAANKNLCAGTGCVNPATGMPTAAGSGQNPENTYNPTVRSVVCMTALPINLLEFNALKQYNTVLLSWASASDAAAGFVVERSADGRSWSAIGKVTVGAVGGTASQSFRYTDNAPLQGNNFYRLQQTDLTGETQYSAVRQVQFANQQLITISPNPAKESVSINGMEGKNNICIYDLTGRPVLQMTTANASEKIGLSNLNAGMYQVRITSEDGSITVQKLLKSNW